MSDTIQSSMLQYHLIYDCLDKATMNSALSVNSIFEKLRDKVRNRTQVRDAIVKAHRDGRYLSEKRGLERFYWSSTAIPSSPKIEVIEHQVRELRVKVNADHSITIITPSLRITVELP